MPIFLHPCLEPLGMCAVNTSMSCSSGREPSASMSGDSLKPAYCQVSSRPFADEAVTDGNGGHAGTP